MKYIVYCRVSSTSCQCNLVPATALPSFTARNLRRSTRYLSSAASDGENTSGAAPEYSRPFQGLRQPARLPGQRILWCGLLSAFFCTLMFSPVASPLILSLLSFRSAARWTHSRQARRAAHCPSVPCSPPERSGCLEAADVERGRLLSQP